jgi:hypothetical protein
MRCSYDHVDLTVALVYGRLWSLGRLVLLNGRVLISA